MGDDDDDDDECDGESFDKSEAPRNYDSSVGM